MIQRILVAGGIATLLLAGCSGGGGGSGPTSRLPASGPVQTVSIAIDANQLTPSSVRRAKFIGPDADDVNYAFSPSFPGSTADQPLSNCTVCTITVSSVPVGSYTVTLTLKNGGANGTVVGQGSASLNVTLGGANSTTVPINPTLTGTGPGPSIKIPENSVFYADGETGQSVVATVNELDPAGVAICGPNLTNWPTLTVSAVPPVSGLTISGSPIGSAPACTSGGSSPGSPVTISYNGNPSPGPTSAAIQVSDGLGHTATGSIPFVSLTASVLSITVTDTKTQYQLSITETNGYWAGETGFTADPAQHCQGVVTVLADKSHGFAPGSPSSPDSTETFDIEGDLDANSGCTLVVESNAHPKLTASTTINLGNQSATLTGQ
jgi:hypothetical protein